MHDQTLESIYHYRSKQFRYAAAYYVGFIALGLAGAVMGPTLLGLAAHTGSTIGQISFLFTARALGYFTGSLISGRLYDRLPGHRVMTSVLILIIGMMLLIPVVPLLWLLAAVLLILGLSEGALDVGGNTLLVWVYREQVAPYMNALHFFFGVGAFISPLIVAQTIQATGDIMLAYWALAVLMLPALLWLSRLPSPQRQVVTEAHRSGRTNWKLLLILVLSFYVYVGAELSLGNWLSTYAIKLRLADAAGAAYLTSAFWGAFTAGRLISIPLATRFTEGAVLLADLIGALAFIALILLFPHSAAVLWIGVCGAGFAMASVFPTMISFAQRHMTITGQITSLFLAGSSLGSMTLPLLIGQLFDSIGPSIMVIFVAAALVIELALYGLLIVVARKNGGQAA
ncbi:MAG: transporter [Chloroflexota bacterium]|nr:transporter [Chloroflexota bacterium]